MKEMFLSVLMVFWLAQTALAGDLKGVVTAAPGVGEGLSQETVVWVEGALPAAVPKAHPVLSQRDVQFAPSFMVVVAGQTVDMPNDDDIAHNVFSLSPAKRFNMGIYPKGESKSVTFDRPGLVDLFCSIHRHMNAKVLVVPNPYYARLSLGRAYGIKDVPAGDYIVKVWNKDLSSQTKSVTVPKTGEVRLDFSLEKDQPK